MPCTYMEVSVWLDSRNIRWKENPNLETLLVSSERVIHPTVSLMAASLWSCLSRLGYPLLQKLASDDNRSLFTHGGTISGIRIATHIQSVLVKTQDNRRHSRGKNRFIYARLPWYGLRSVRNIDFSYTRSSICVLSPLQVDTAKNTGLVFC